MPWPFSSAQFPDGIKQERHRLSSGHVALPILYRDLTAIMVSYSADASAVQSSLPSPRLKVPAHKGRCLLTLAAFEYRDTTIGPYNEFAVMAPIICAPIVPGAPLNLLLRKTPLGRLGGHILHLPVTTRIALDAGKEIWGFPKILADIRFEISAESIACSLGIPRGPRILKLCVPRKEGIGFPFPDMHLYTVKGDQILEIRVPTRGSFRRLKTAGVTLDLGQHPMARQLRGLGLSPKPVFAMVSTNLRTRLPESRRSFPLAGTQT